MNLCKLRHTNLGTCKPVKVTTFFEYAFKGKVCSGVQISPKFGHLKNKTKQNKNWWSFSFDLCKLGVLSLLLYDM